MDRNKILNLISGTLVALVVLLVALLIFSKLPIPGNFKVLTVLSGSMEPAIHTGAVVIVNPASEYVVGDIITFGETGKTGIPVTHRIKEEKLAEGKTIYTTKGDANDSADARSVANEEIQGKVLFSLPYLGYVLEFIKKPVGFTVIVVLPAVLIIIDETRKIIKELVKKPATEPVKKIS